MALHQIASYGDSDSESSDTEITQKTEKRKQIVSILPRKRTAQESSVKEHVKIILPQLEADSSDDEDTTPRKKSHSMGLTSLLPQPKRNQGTKSNSSSFIPYTVKRLKQNQSDCEEDSNVKFFSNLEDTKPSKSSDSESMPIIDHSIDNSSYPAVDFNSITATTNQTQQVYVYPETTPHIPSTSSSSEEVTLPEDDKLTMNEAMLCRLAGGGGRKKKQKAEEASLRQMMDISENEIKDAVAYKKYLTEQHSHTSGTVPENLVYTSTQKRKHQITWLARQAKEREQELKNFWSQAATTRKQTQMKYGF